MLTISKDEFVLLRKEVLEKEFSRMNDMQQKAIFDIDGPLLILAGAGSGKTTVVVNRIANIIRFGSAYQSTFVQDEVTDADVNEMKKYLVGGVLSDETRNHLSVSACQPWKVMAITFTNKAAGELKERLVDMLGADGNDIWASTFHSTCARILRRDGDNLGYTNHFTIYDMDDARRLMRDCMKKLDIIEKNFPAKSILSEISRAKDSLTTPADFEASAGSDFRLKTVAKAYTMYQSRLKAANAMDFDDLIVNTVKLFKEFPDVLDYYQNRFKYLMVDEYQDTNQAQYQLVKLLADKNRNICVVGDDDQSIYKFRGATIENIMGFERTFENARTIRLEQNYRSTQNILDAANKVVSNNTERKGKNLWTNNGEGSLVTIHTAENEQDEADQIANEILKMVSEGKKYSDFAVLYRMNSQSLSFERMFAKQGIPHRILGGVRFYDRAEIKDMLAYLCVVNNPSDEIRLRRIINQPKRGIGERTIDIAAEIARQTGVTLFDVICNSEKYPDLSKASKKLMEFGKMITGFIEVLLNDEKSINELYLKIIEDVNYTEFLKNDDLEKSSEKIENIRELSTNILRFEQESEEGVKPLLSNFLEEISLITDIDNYDAGKDSVVLMTIHSAKGLEFPIVFLPGWEENIFPGMASIYNPEEIEEERRLAYVAITRAKEYLFIYHADMRMIFGTTSRNKLSRFAQEIPEELVEHTSSNRFSRTFGVGTAGTSPRIPSFGNKAVKANQAVSTAGGFNTPTKTTSKVIYKVGDTVNHKTFGDGLILSSRSMGNDTLLEIAFDAGTKLLGANFAKLQIK